MTAALEGGEWSAARPGRTLPPGKTPVPILEEAGWAPGAVWTGRKSRPHQDSIPDRPTRSSVAIPTELPGPLFKCVCFHNVMYSSFTQGTHQFRGRSVVYGQTARRRGTRNMKVLCNSYTHTTEYHPSYPIWLTNARSV